MQAEGKIVGSVKQNISNPFPGTENIMIVIILGFTFLYHRLWTP